MQVLTNRWSRLISGRTKGPYLDNFFPWLYHLVNQEWIQPYGCPCASTKVGVWRRVTFNKMANHPGDLIFYCDVKMYQDLCFLSHRKMLTYLNVFLNFLWVDNWGAWSITRDLVKLYINVLHYILIHLMVDLTNHESMSCVNAHLQ